MGKKAVFLDRDGTLAPDVPYCSRPEDFNLFEDVPRGIKKLNDNGFIVIVITNQSGIARGYFTEEKLSKIHDKLKRELNEVGAYVDGIYYCPHHPDDGCNCRKPSIGLFEKAIKDYDIDVKSSYLIGDRMLDIEAGYRIGCKNILVPENNHKEKVMKELERSKIKPDKICKNFDEAVYWILNDSEKEEGGE